MPTNSADSTTTDQNDQGHQDDGASSFDAILAAYAEVDVPTRVELDSRAVRTTIDLVERASAADLYRPTPCAGWTLYGLLAHMSAQHNGFAAAAGGDDQRAHWEWPPLGDDPIATYRASAERVLNAFQATDLAERWFPMPEAGPGVRLPAAMTVSMHLLDYVAHAWDVARTLDLRADVDPEAVEAALQISEIVPDGEARVAPGAPFGPRLTWSGGSRLDELVAALGRYPDWRPYKP